MKRGFLIIVTIFLLCNIVIGQKNSSNPISQGGKTLITRDAGKLANEYQIEWNLPHLLNYTENEAYYTIGFDNASYPQEYDFLPTLLIKKAVGNKTASINVKITNTVYEEFPNDFNLNSLKGVKRISSEPIIDSYIAFEKKSPIAHIYIVPIRKNENTGKYERLKAFDIQTNTIEEEKAAPTAKSFVSNSVLANGTWYKIAVGKNGVYRIDYNFLVGLGIQPDVINPKHIRIYGNGGKMLPEKNADFTYDDLVENAIFVQGESDGKFDPQDYILFYGQEAHTWNLNSSSGLFEHQLHLYSDTTYYFLNFDLGNGKRISNISSNTLSPTHTITSFNDYAFSEKENTNLIKSGRTWLGETFDALLSYNFGFSFPNLEVNSTTSIKMQVAARHDNNTQFIISAHGNSQTINASAVPTSCYYCAYASASNDIMSFNTPAGNAINVSVQYNKTGSSIGWLDYIEVNCKRQLIMAGDQMSFRHTASVGTGNIAEYILGNYSSDMQVWEVSDPFNINRVIGNQNGNNYLFKLSSNTLREFIAFKNQNYLTPVRIGRISNQNLHSLNFADFLIVTHPQFTQQANELADFHRNDGLSVHVVNVEEIYNEFSSGSRDISAIRNFVRMFYERASNITEMPKYLLLFGDGSYKNRTNSGNNTNFIPTYQSPNSFDPTASYVSDDYFGLLDPNEGGWLSTGIELIDIGIGRFPVKNKNEAQAVVNKIKVYNTTATMRNWRNIVAFIGDDEDGSLHTKDAEKLAEIVDTTYKNYNIEKIYFDAYRQESTPGGQRYPEVNEAIKRRVEQGSLIINYTGHGGETGWAHERVLNVQDINAWRNNNMPLFFTATCEFSRFDDPNRTSGGELVLLNPDGGGVALFTTVRLVYSFPNYVLNKCFYETVFEEYNGEMPRMGDVFRLTKNAAGGDLNHRNFTFLGDPALRLAYPKERVTTTHINNNPIITITDTLKALSKVTVKGFVSDKNGQKNQDFNGIIYPTVYDKKLNLETLENDGSTRSPKVNFKVWRNIIYRGKASVKNGDFTFTFVVPKDIAYNYDFGRISYYAENQEYDAHGHFEKFIVGGFDENAPADNAGPIIKLYMNDEKFVFGGTTNENPRLLAYIEDENGINTTGSGIGHDITTVKNNETAKTIILNDYYEADLDSYQSGKVKYPFFNLEEGRYSLKFKAWDVYNNPGDAYTEFVVAKSAKLALNHVLNYPNPFTTNTQFMFEHNQPGIRLDVQIQIFTVSGKLVKTIETFSNNDGFRIDGIKWDGKDEYGDKIGRGVYIYRIKVKSQEGMMAEKFEKLVILN
jgi:hypothetical protein